MTSDEIKVSCVMSTKNRPNFVKKSIQMFNNQTYLNKELIIVDDSDIQLNIQASNVKYIYCTKNCSIGNKRNTGISKATGEVILLWDDDDYHGKDRITNQLHALLKSKKDGIVYNSCVYYNLPSEILYIFPKKIHNQLWKYGYIAGTFMFYKHLFSEHGIKYKNKSFREDILFIEDIINRGFKIATLRIPDGDFVYVKHNNSTMMISHAYAKHKTKVTKKQFYSSL